jgi:hypothetical protein
VEAFVGSLHKGLVNKLLSKPKWVKNVNKPANDEIKKAEEDACEAVKAALLISGAEKRRYGMLKDELANLLGTNQYPNTFEKAMHILGNY